jgi:5-methylcytosine-specific restriction enzyme A
MAASAPQHKRASIGTSHQKPKAHAARRRSGSARERGYSTAWGKFSKAFLLANPLCEFCLGEGKIKAATVTDHDLPHKGDEEMFWANTFTALCGTCHSKTKQALEATLSGAALLDAIARRKAGVPQG